MRARVVWTAVALLVFGIGMLRGCPACDAYHEYTMEDSLDTPDASLDTPDVSLDTPDVSLDASPSAGITPLPRRRKPGPALPESCKMWGDVYGANPELGAVKRNVKATYHFYSPGYATATLACADKFWATPNYSKMLLQYPWTAYCLKDPAFSQSTCGKCFRVTNRRTGANIIVRAVDRGGCSDADGTGLDLDPCAFNAIDTDKQGYRDGNMRVDVQEVQC